MNVNIIFSKDLSSTVDLDTAWQLFYVYQQGAKKAGETIDASRLTNWNKVEKQLQEASEGSVINFSLMGDIYYENGKAGFKDDDAN